MSDLPILTPSECATLKEAWARIEVSNYRQQFGRLPFDLRSDAVTVIDAAPRMLATIAALRLEVEGWAARRCSARSAGSPPTKRQLEERNVRFGTCFTTSDPHPSLAQLHALRAIGITDMRLSIDLPSLCPVPDPALWQWLQLDQLVADVRAAGIEPYFNPGGCPVWASEGQPAFGGLIPGTAWWNAPGHRDAAGNVDEFAHGIHYFDQDSSRTDSVRDSLTGEMITGPELAAIDQQQPPRPYLVNPPEMDAAFFRAIGRELTRRYSPKLIGVGNEYGQEMFNPWVRKDISRDGSVDMIREHLAPEMVRPFFDGVADAQTFLNPWRRIGPDGDSDIIVQRCLDAGLRYDILAGHLYGDINGLAYATTEAFLKVANGRELWCTEIDAATPVLLEWTKERCAKKDIGAIYYLRPGMFFEGDGYAIPNDPKLSDGGRAFAAEFAKINGPVDPIRTTMPVKRRRAVKK